MKMHRRQQGITLIMALIMLVLLTMLALTSYNLGNSNLRIVSNMQQRGEGIVAAREVLEETISSTRFFETPNAALANPCDGVANQRCVDTNNDSVTDIKVVLTPAPVCVLSKPILNSELDLADPEDADCSVGINQLFGISGAATGNSECFSTVFDVHAVATDVVTEANVEIVQGIAVRVAKDDIKNKCHNIP